MIRSLAAAAAVLTLCTVPLSPAAGADPATASKGAFTLAVFGDEPYGTVQGDHAQFDATPAFIDSINADPDVSTVVHLGDIHSGKQWCTQPYDQSIYDMWTRFSDPLVYTPGDNEWTDCHKAAEGGGKYDPSTGQVNYVIDPATGQPADYAAGNPVANLALVRSMFFAKPGQTLGSGSLAVLSQAQVADPAHPSDAQYVENVRWEYRGIVFVTINVPGGSNNDADPWYGAPTASSDQQNEAAQRTAADLRWLDSAFSFASRTDAAGVVVITQADLWDLDGNTPAHLTNYEPIVSSLAGHTTGLGKPVLLLTGDSHVYRSDNPLMQGAPCTGDNGVCGYDAWNSHPYYNVANFHRIVVHGSTFPLEWLKLTAAPGAHNPTTATSFGPFSWVRMPQG
ncbi:MAG TPA: metallophosphoesterase [Jatrophihabitans sp.]|nr:metallophosphoesterase [Jatrophihabitans sp.]